MRRGDERYRRLVKAVARLASPTGKWPEAVHPRTLGGCMGDGEHGWAAAEWCEMMRALFVRESEDGLIIGEGLFPEWFEAGESLSYGPTLTPYGEVTVKIDPDGDGWLARVEGKWRGTPPPMRLKIEGFDELDLPDDGSAVKLAGIASGV